MASNAADSESAPNATNTTLAATTNPRDRPLDASHASKLPRQPIVAPAAPPIHPAVRSDHHALPPPVSMSARLPAYSTSLIGPSHTVPGPGRNTLISSLVGGPLAPVRSNGSMNFRQAVVPLIFPISPEI